MEGSVEGDVTIQGDFVVAAGARVHGSVEAHGVVVEGDLEGDILATGPVHAGAGASLRGNVKGQAFTMEEGATVSVTVDADFDLPPELQGGRE